MARVWLPVRRTAWLSAVVWARGARLPRLLTIRRDDERSRPAARLTGALAGDRQERFTQWFEQYRVPLLDYVFGMTRDRDWAADLVQEAFLRAYAAAGDPGAIAQPLRSRAPHPPRPALRSRRDEQGGSTCSR